VIGVEGNGATSAAADLTSPAAGVKGAAGLGARSAAGVPPVSADVPSPHVVAASENGAQREAGAAGAAGAAGVDTLRSAASRGGRGRNNDAAPRRTQRPRPEPRPEGAPGAGGSVEGKTSCTLAQMRRFIKSRPYVPVHELRRRFLIEGIEDEVNPMPSGDGILYVGLPEREAGFLGELVKAGEVGCELLLDPTSPAIIGVFPMRPVARQ